MQITPVSFNYNNYNQMKLSNVSSINFQGLPQKLIPVDSNSFSTEFAPKLYSKMKKYFHVIGSEGSIKNVKILNGNYETYEPDVFLSINKNPNKSKIRLSLKYNGKGDFTLLDAIFNKDGQMVLGELPDDSLHFERSNRNIRRLVHNNCTYLPVGKSDKDWDANGRRIRSNLPIDNCVKDGAYEIFMELARLNTSILK